MNFINTYLKKALAIAFVGAMVVSFAPSTAQADALSVSCSPNPANPYTGDNVSFYASATGGLGNYTYMWTGTDGITGTGSTVTHSFYNVGQQSATVTVTSNGQTQSSTCYVNVLNRSYYNGNNNYYGNGYNGNYGRLSASCLSIPTTVNTGDNVTWMIQNLSGGNGIYTYSWTGTDGLTSNGQTAYKSYTYGGVKNASVNITSGDGQVYSANCSPITVNGSPYGNTNYNNYPYNNNYSYNGSLGVSCYATPSQANLYDSVTWYANVTGGNGYYTYNWSGTDGLIGTGQNLTKMYSSVGQKVANITVYSNGQSVTNSCVMNVGSTNNNYYYNNNGYYNNGNGTYYPINYPYNNSYQYNGGYTNGYYSGYYPSTGTVIQNPPSNVNYVYPQTTVANPVSGVFLSSLPSTGISFSMKMFLFTFGIVLWSLFATYMIVEMKKKKAFKLAGSSAGSVPTGAKTEAERIAEFKKINLMRKGIK